MPCFHGLCHRTNGQWFVVCKSHSGQLCDLQTTNHWPAKLCRVCTVLLIVLMARDLSFASQKVPKSGPSALRKMWRSADAGRICSDFFGCLRPSLVLQSTQLSKAISFFPCQEVNRLHLQPQRRLRQLLLEEGPLPPLVSRPRDRVFLPGGAWHWRTALWAYCTLERLKVPLSNVKLRKDCWGGQKECCNCSIASFENGDIDYGFASATFVPSAPAPSWSGVNSMNVKMNSRRNFLGPKRPTFIAYAKKAIRNLKWSTRKTSTLWLLWLVRRKNLWKQHICCKSFWQSGPKAKGQRWAWCWTDWHQSNIDRHCSGFVSPTENGGMHGTPLDVGFSLQVTSMHLHVYILHHLYFLNLLDMTSDQPFCQDAGSMSWLRCKAVASGVAESFIVLFVWLYAVASPSFWDVLDRMLWVCGVAMAMHVKRKQQACMN